MTSRCFAIRAPLALVSYEDAETATEAANQLLQLY